MRRILIFYTFMTLSQHSSNFLSFLMCLVDYGQPVTIFQLIWWSRNTATGVGLNGDQPEIKCTSLCANTGALSVPSLLESNGRAIRYERRVSRRNDRQIYVLSEKKCCNILHDLISKVISKEFYRQLWAINSGNKITPGSKYQYSCLVYSFAI